MNLWAKLMGRARSRARLAEAEALAEAGRHDEALAGYDRALKLDPRLAMALRGKARVLDSMGRHADALETIELSLQADPGLALAWRTKGAVLRNLGRDAEGLACYERGLAIDPHDALLWVNRGKALLRFCRLAEARASFERALSIDPGSTAASAGLRISTGVNSSGAIVKDFRRDPPNSERMVVTVSGADDLKRWLSVMGFDLKSSREVTGFSSSTLVGSDNSDHYEHFDHHYKDTTSLWLDSCRLGDWGTSSEREVWFVFEPNSNLDQAGPQRDGWNRLAELLTSIAKLEPPPK